MKKRRAFTLFELLVTLSIISILAGFALPNYQENKVQELKQTMQGEISSSIGLIEKVKQNTPVDTFTSDLYTEDEYVYVNDQGVVPVSVGDSDLKFISNLKNSEYFIDSGCCDLESDTCVPGYYIALRNEDINYKLVYDSCTQNVPLSVDFDSTDSYSFK